MLTPPAALEALLFASGEPLPKKELMKLLELGEEELETVLNALATSLRNRGIALVDAGKEVELRTAPDAAAIVKKFRESELSRDLGKAGLETLAIVAYHEGVTRSEVDWIRGVNSSTSMRTLLVRGLIRGEEDERDRRRIRYRLTTDALAHLGASASAGLPRHAELAKEIATVVRREETDAS